VVAYEEEEIGEALRRLMARGWAREVHQEQGRVVKYRQVLDEALDLDSAELSLVAVLLLRGVQTAGELKERSVRLYECGSVRAVHESLGRLVDRGLVARHARRSGQKEERYEQRLDLEDVAGAQESSEEEERDESASVEEQVPTAVAEENRPEDPPSGAQEASSATSSDGASVEARLEWLEAEVVKLRAQMASLLKELGE